MKKKRIVIALGHEALGSTLPEQQKAAARTAKAVADFIREDYQVVITHSNGPQVGMIHTAMNEFCRLYPEYTATPTSVCSAMSQGYIGYDLQNAIRTELLNRGIYKTVSTVLTQVVVDPYDEAFYHPTKVIGRVMTKEEAGFDMEIVEKHHKHKLDAPSGTALALADSMNEALGNAYHYTYDRSDRREERDPKEIGISAVRGGNIVGEHEVIFAGTDEVIEFKHTAYSKAVFGKGAVQAAKFMAGREPGLYDMQDVIAANA